MSYKGRDLIPAWIKNTKWAGIVSKSIYVIIVKFLRTQTFMLCEKGERIHEFIFCEKVQFQTDLEFSIVV